MQDWTSLRENGPQIALTILATADRVELMATHMGHGPQGRGYNNWFLRIRKKQKSLGADQRAKALAELI